MTGDLVALVVWWLAALAVLWRWPGLTVGMAGALALWVVAPWAAWLCLVVVAAFALGWRRRGRGPVVWPSLRRLTGRPVGWAVLSALGVAVLGPSRWAPGALLVAVPMLVGAAVRRWVAVPNRPAGVGPIEVVGGRKPAGPVGGSGVVERSALVVGQGRCPWCGSMLTAALRLPAGARPRLPGGVLGPAECGCGAELVAVVDPAWPEAGVRWLPAEPERGGRSA